MRALIYMLDALFAVVIAALLLQATLAVRLTKTGMGEDAALHRTAQDVLALMDKDGTLKGLFSQTDSAARATLNASLNELLPAHMAGRANATLCMDDGDEDFGDFVCNRNIVVANAANRSLPTAMARRLFVDAVAMRYGYIALEVWYR
ncbi:MAG: hypothetical protein QXG98_01725 [Candidatus Micrarchaeia archaeon]